MILARIPDCQLKWEAFMELEHDGMRPAAALRAARNARQNRPWRLAAAGGKRNSLPNPAGIGPRHLLP
jgi:hypothetical protein